MNEQLLLELLNAINKAKLISELEERTSISDNNSFLPINLGTEDAKKIRVALLRGSLGQYNASTNTPTLADGTGLAGDTYEVSTAGTRDFGSGAVQMSVGDIIYHTGTKWTNIIKSKISDVIGLQDILDALTGSLVPQGNWDANTNTPDISATTETGYYWIVSVTGSTDIGGITDWVVNDWVVKTSDGWAKIDNTDKVTSVAGKTGIVTLDSSDITDFNTEVSTIITTDVDKPFIDALNVDADTLDGLDSLDFVRKTGDVNETITGNKNFSNNLTFKSNLDNNPVSLNFINTDGLDQSTGLMKYELGKFIFDRDIDAGSLNLTNINPNIKLGSGNWEITKLELDNKLYINAQDGLGITKVLELSNDGNVKAPNFIGNGELLNNVNSSLLNNISATNLSLGESYARIKQRYFLDNAYTVYPTDAGFQYAKLLQANLLRNASIFILPQATKVGLLGVEKGSDLDVVRAANATYVDENDVIQTALANVPRIDFTNGTGSLLVEPQRTNITTYSEDFSNVVWIKERSTLTISAVKSPRNIDSYIFEDNAFSGPHSFGNLSSTLVIGEDYTFSIYAKKNTADWFQITGNSTAFGPNFFMNVNLATGVVGSVGSSVLDYEIDSLVDGWYRISVKGTSLATTGGIVCALINNFDNTFRLPGYVGTGLSVYVSGAQTELDDLTSFIPTVASTVTRNADVISKTGITGVTTITETFEDGTTNVITGSPTSYTMSEGRIISVISE